MLSTSWAELKVSAASFVFCEEASDKLVIFELMEFVAHGLKDTSA